MNLNTVATTALVGCALAITTVVVHREFGSAGGEPPLAPIEQIAAQGPAEVAGWRRYAASGHRMGPENAAVTIVVFSDFQCPACRVLAESLAEIRRRHPGRVAIVYRHFPLPIHPAAKAAAHASDCASEQGRFEAFHDALFMEQDRIGLGDWSHFARVAHVPELAAFERCVSRVGTSATLERDAADGRALDVRATPTLLINGRRLTGAPRLHVLAEIVGREM